VHSLKLFSVKIRLVQQCIKKIRKSMTQNTEYLNNDDFLILVFEIQDVDINCNIMKTTNKSERDINRCFWFGQLDRSIQSLGIRNP